MVAFQVPENDCAIRIKWKSQLRDSRCDFIETKIEIEKRVNGRNY